MEEKLEFSYEAKEAWGVLKSLLKHLDDNGFEILVREKGHFGGFVLKLGDEPLSILSKPYKYSRSNMHKE